MDLDYHPSYFMLTASMYAVSRDAIISERSAPLLAHVELVVVN